MEIKKYLGFITESLAEKYNREHHSSTIRLMAEDDRERFLRVLQYINDDDNFISFSKMACQPHRWNDPEGDFQRMNADMLRRFSIEDIKTLFSPRINQILGEDYFEFVKNNAVNKRHKLNEDNGSLDWYLYKLAKEIGLDPVKKIPLGGDTWSNNEEYNDRGEYNIRYSYGYHRTPYGQLFIESVGLTTAEFRREAFKFGGLNDGEREYAEKMFIYDWIRCLPQEDRVKMHDSINLIWKTHYGAMDDQFKEDSSKFIRFEEDEDRIIFDLEDFLKDLNSKLKEKLVLDIESSLKQLGKVFRDDVDYVNNMIVVYLK